MVRSIIQRLFRPRCDHRDAKTVAWYREPTHEIDLRLLLCQDCGLSIIEEV